MGKILTTYSKEIKEKAVRLYFEEGVGSTTIARELGIPSHKIVMRWVRHFENEGLEGLEEKRGKSRGFRKGRPRKHPMSLEEENVRLRAESVSKKVARTRKAVKNQKGQAKAYAIIKELSERYPILMLCSLAGVSRSGYYKWVARQQGLSSKMVEDEDLKTKILECHQEVNKIYGYPRVKVWLRQKYGIYVNHKRVYRLMRELGIQACIRKKRKHFGHKEKVVISENKLNREFTASRPNEKWVTDITYVIFNGRRLYLSVIYDLFNNEVVAYKMRKRNDLRLVIDTVKAAIKKGDVSGVLLHSDQGFQYTSRQYNQLLQQYNITASMSRKGNCLDNACIESFFSHLKSECLYLYNFQTDEEVYDAVNRYIHFYNHRRFQTRLNNLSPVQFRAQAA